MKAAASRSLDVYEALDYTTLLYNLSVDRVAGVGISQKYYDMMTTNDETLDDQLRIVHTYEREVQVSLVTKDIVMYYKDGTRFGAYLYDNYGRPLANKVVTFSMQGVDYTRTTNQNGYASIAINLNVPDAKIRRKNENSK